MAEHGLASPIALRVNCFKGLQTLPLLTAISQGYCAREGLEVELSYTTGSADQLRRLARGEYDLVQTAPDNVIAFDADPTTFGVDAANAPRVVMLLGGSNGPLALYARPGVSTLGDLRGAALGVDNPASGFALVLRDLLAHGGLHLEHDYTFTVVGSTRTRLDALLRGELAATLLYAPFDLLAAAAGCAALASSADAYPAYASQATAVCAPWLAAHQDAVQRLLVAELAALRWIFDLRRRAAVEALLTTEPVFGIDAALAAQAYDAFTDPAAGFGRDAALDDAGLAQVIALRQAYMPTARGLESPAAYCDPRLYHRARLALLLRGAD
jgi:ABC-type nitrate/sulfonate/bicarbonate transport system substrate-binding protein